MALDQRTSGLDTSHERRLAVAKNIHAAAKKHGSFDVLATHPYYDLLRGLDGSIGLELKLDNPTVGDYLQISGAAQKAIADHHREMVASAYEDHGEPSAGCLAYNGYRDEHWAAHVTWGELPEDNREAWEAAATAVLDGVEPAS